MIWLCALGFVGLNSCIDDTYDLSKEIDKTVTIGGNLTIPASSIDDIKLKDILDIDENSSVKANENGDYSIIQNGNPSISYVNIPEVSLSNSINFEGISKTQTIPQDNAGNSVLPEMEIDFERININMNIFEDNIAKELVDIEYAETSSPNTGVIISINDGIEGILKKGYTITFPDYLTIETSENGISVIDGHILKFERDIEVSESEKQIKINITKITFNGESAKFTKSENSTIELNGNINVDGKVVIPEQTLNVFGIDEIKVNIDVVCSSIIVENVKAVLNPDINISISPIRIDNLPDFLSDDEVRIDMTDPRLYLKVTNESPVEVNLKAILIPYKNGQALNSVSIGGKDRNITIPGNVTDYIICLHRSESNEGLIADDFITVSDINNLIQIIPDEIRMDNIEANATDKFVNIGADMQYNVTTDYRIDAPLMFNEQTNIVYSDKMDGWSEDIDDADFSKIEISMDVINNLPLDLGIGIDAIDKQGSIMENVNVSVDGGISANSTKTLNILVESVDGDIKGLDGIKFKVICKGNNETVNTCLNENQVIKIDNLKLKLVGGITMELK